MAFDAVLDRGTAGGLVTDAPSGLPSQPRRISPHEPERRQRRLTGSAAEEEKHVGR